MLSSLLSQLCTALQNVPGSLKSLYAKCENGLEKASEQQLIVALLKCAGEYTSTYLVIDALDECPKDGDERKELLTTIGALHEQQHSNIKFFLTSRPEHDIKTSLLSLAGLTHISIQGSEVELDIALYIRNQIATDPKLVKWSDIVKVTIIKELASGAHGMYMSQQIQYIRLLI